MSWKCKGCGEQIEATFETCWNCGTDQDGLAPAAASRARIPEETQEASETTRPHTQEVPVEARSQAVTSTIKLPNLPGERLLLELHDGDFTLTTHRLRHRSERIGGSSIVSIMLEELTSCSLTRRTKPWLLAMAFAMFVLGVLAVGRQDSFWGGAIAAVVFVVAYMTTRRTVLAFASSGERVLIDVGSTPIDAVTRIINQVEAAKNARHP